YIACTYAPKRQRRDSDFAPRVEEPITAIDPAPYAHSGSPNDFATRIDSNETLFETAESPAVKPPAPPPPAPSPEFTPTELVTAVSPPDEVGLADAESFRPAEVGAPPSVNREEWPAKTPTPPTPQVTSSDLDRRTTVMAEQSSHFRKSTRRIL